MKRLQGLMLLLAMVIPVRLFAYTVEVDPLTGGTFTADAYDPQVGINDQWVDTDGDGATDLETELSVRASGGTLTVNRTIPLHHPGTNYAYSAVNRVYREFDENVDISGTGYVGFMIKDEFVYDPSAGPTNTENKIQFKLFTEDAVWQSVYIDVPQDGEWHQVVIALSSLVNVKNYKPEISMDKVTGYSLRFTKSGECEIRDFEAVSFFEETFPPVDGALMTNGSSVRFYLNIPFDETNLAPSIGVSNLTAAVEIGFIYNYNTNYRYLELTFTNHGMEAGNRVQVRFDPTIALSAEGLPYYPVGERNFVFYYDMTNAVGIALSNLSVSGDTADIDSISATSTKLTLGSTTKIFDVPLEVVWFSPSNVAGIMLSNRMGLFEPDYDSDFGLYRFSAVLAGDYYLVIPGQEGEAFNFELEQNPFTPNSDGFGDEMVLIVNAFRAGEIKVTVTDQRGREIAELYDGDVDEGETRITWDGDDASAGMYFVVIQLKIGSRLYKDAGAVVLWR